MRRAEAGGRPRRGRRPGPDDRAVGVRHNRTACASCLPDLSDSPILGDDRAMAAAHPLMTAFPLDAACGCVRVASRCRDLPHSAILALRIAQKANDSESRSRFVISRSAVQVRAPAPDFREYLLSNN